MKKLLVLVTIMVAFAASGFAQAPKCQNDGKIDGFIQQQEAQGWQVQSVTWWPVLYLVPPTPPYLNGTLQIALEPICEPDEPCPRILKLATFDNYVQNDNGTCIWK